MTFMAGPATETRILDKADAGGIEASSFFLAPSTVPVVACSLFPAPSIALEVTICGNLTKPPAGIQRREYSTPLRFQETILGPKPMANSSTTRPRLRATQK